MNARADRVDEGRHTLWARLWYALHGPNDVTPDAEREAAWARIADLETSAKELSALEALETARRAADDERE